MRVRVFREGVPTTDGRLTLPGTLQLPDDRIPVFRQPRTYERPGHYGSILAGVLSEVFRVNEGWITGDIWVHDKEGLEGCAAEADLDDVATEPHCEHLVVITRGRLRAVTLGVHPCWPGMVIR